MATSPTAASSSRSASRPSSLLTTTNPPPDPDPDPDPDLNLPSPPLADVPVETLVEHLLAAKRALSAMNLVLQGNELATTARALHERAAVLGAQTAFVRRGIAAQARVLVRARRRMGRALAEGKRDFKALLRMLDAANARLEKTMEMLRGTIVEAVFRPEGEEPRNLLDFVDEKEVFGVRAGIKECISELQATQTSFDGDILRFENDLRTLEHTMNSAPSLSPSETPDARPMPDLLASLTERSHEMAASLTSLTRHFDLCVIAVRTTDGGAALARRKAAEAGPPDPNDPEPVSLSGVINAASEAPASAADRADMLAVVLHDAAQVDGVVADLAADLGEMRADADAVRRAAARADAAYAATLAAFAVLDDVGARLPGYVEAEAEFADRWAGEKEVLSERLQEMGAMREFYEGYASAYDTLILEAARRRAVEDKIGSVWRKARDSVDKLVEADRRERDVFRQDIGEFLPTDLWEGMADPLRRWDLVSVHEGGGGVSAAAKKRVEGSVPALDRSVVAAAKERLERSTSGT